MISLTCKNKGLNFPQQDLGKVWGKFDALRCNHLVFIVKSGAGDGLRTRDPQLGRLEEYINLYLS